MRKILFLIAQCCFLVTAHSQSIGITTSSPNSSAALDITNTGKGLLIPRGTTAANFIGTTDNKPLRFMVNNQWSGEMDSATHSVYIGYSSGAQNQGAMDNTAIGHKALSANTTGISNTANGFTALQFNTTGSYNIAIGAQALSANTTGSSNIAIGGSALGVSE